MGELLHRCHITKGHFNSLEEPLKNTLCIFNKFINREKPIIVTENTKDQNKLTPIETVLKYKFKSFRENQRYKNTSFAVILSLTD